MEKNEAINEILNDLVKINNDRMTGYEKAIAESKDLDIDLKALFEQMIHQSGEYKEELVAEIGKNEGVVEDDTTASGKIYRAWMDIKSTMQENDRHSILASCEFGEDAAQRAYEAAIAQLVPGSEVQSLIRAQQASLKKSHELIKTQRNAHKALVK